MRIKIKDVENGWLVRYDEMMVVDLPVAEKVGEKEKAFTYDFEDEREDAWRKLECFVAWLFLPYGLHKEIYLQTYDEEKGEWVGNQEFQRRLQERGARERKEKKEKGFTGPCIPMSKQEKKIFKKWEKERIARMTLGQWELECAELTFYNLQQHFDKNKEIYRPEYNKIRVASEKQTIEKFGSRP